MSEFVQRPGEVPESFPSPSPFQTRVYAACARIPAGKVCSYGDLARAVGCGSAQAVGQALRRNPFAPTVPCHRVVAANGRLHGFSGSRHVDALDRKRQLLLDEGVKLDAQGRVSPACFHVLSTDAPGPQHA